MSCDLLLSSASPLHPTILRAHRRLMSMLGPRLHQNHAIDQEFCYTTSYLPKLGMFSFPPNPSKALVLDVPRQICLPSLLCATLPK